jgi:hypothetical protein
MTIEAAPSAVTDRNCSICRRYGVLWAYYLTEQVRVAEGGATDIYVWGERAIAFHRCHTCGCVTHWTPLDPARKRMGVNARLMSPQVLSQARVLCLDRAGKGEYLDR